MTGRIQYLRVTIFIAIFASVIGYLAYAPNSEGIDQLNRVRAIVAPMKIAHLIVDILSIIIIQNVADFHRELLWNYLVYQVVLP
jgi:hypothetical protein